MNHGPSTATTKAPGRLLHRLDWFIFSAQQVSCRPLVFFRIAIGVMVALQYLAMFTDLEYMFGSKTLLPPEVLGLYTDEYLITNHDLRSWLGLDSGSFSVLFSACYLAAAIGLITGIFSRWAAGLLLLLHVSLFSSNVFFMYGADYFLRMSLFYLVIFPSGDLFSLTGRSRNQTNLPNYLVYRRFLQFHLLLVYFFSGLDKIIGYNWRNGEALWKALNLPHVNTDYRLDFSWLANYSWLAAVLGWSVLLIELGYPMVMWRRCRPFVLAGVIIMHLGIAAVMNLYFFAAIMIIWNLAAFYNFEPSNEKGRLQRLRQDTKRNRIPRNTTEILS